MRTPIQWPQESIDFLRANYETTTSAQMAEALGVSQPTLYRKMRQLGITGSGKVKPRAKNVIHHARAAKVGLYYGAPIPTALRERLASVKIEAAIYADAFDAFAEKNIHPYIRPWQLTDKRYYEGRVVDQFGAVHHTSDSNNWTDAANKCLDAAIVIFQKRVAGGWS